MPTTEYAHEASEANDVGANGLQRGGDLFVKQFSRLVAFVADHLDRRVDASNYGPLSIHPMRMRDYYLSLYTGFSGSLQPGNPCHVRYHQYYLRVTVS